MIIRRTSDGRELLKRVAVARTPWERARGLLGRAGIGRDEGYMIPRCQSVHTFFMRFSIGLVFVDERNVVVSVRKNVKPWRAARERKAAAVIECAPDSEFLDEVKVGDALEIIKG